MRSFLTALIFALPLTAGAAPFTVQSLQNVTAAVPRATAEQLAESELWRQAYVRCSPWLATTDATAPIRLGPPKVTPGTNGGVAFLKVTASFACGLGAAPDLKERLASARDVVVGRVVAIRPVAKTGPISEHDPDTHIATIEITESLKGSATRKIDVQFQASMDIAWFRSPKLHVGQDGVFVLQPSSGGLAVESPLDVHPTAQRGDIWQVLHER